MEDCELCRPAVPRRHVANFFDMSAEEQGEMLGLLNRAQKFPREKHAPDGYNLGANIGKAAGQARDPRGGIRCVLKR